MGTLGFWSMLAIFYQTILAIIMSWLTLDCKFAPSKDELHEVTLMKILYLYDPEACGTVHFYNVTSTLNEYGTVYSSVVWPVRNQMSAEFRTKIQLWLSLHIFWLFFAIVSVTQGQRSCSFYLTILPFTVTGLTLLITDVVNGVMFLLDAKYTSTELAILRYITNRGLLRAMHRNLISQGEQTGMNQEDTSWIAVLFAYTSMRGFVQWVVNFWIVKDSYFGGLADFRIKQKHTRPTVRKRSTSSD